MSLSEAEINCVYALASENNNRFTEDLFYDNIKRFKKTSQIETLFGNIDFTKFLKLLSNAKVCGIYTDEIGREFGVMRNVDTVKILKELRDIDYTVYCIIERAGNKGIWTADIRKISGLLIHQIQRSVKNLSEVKRLIKPVTDVHHRNRKLYMLNYLEPAVEITGGSFYLNGEFNEVLVEHMQDKIGAFLAKNQGSNLKQITAFLQSCDTLRGEILEEDVMAVIRVLMLEEKVYSAVVANQQEIYIWAGGCNLTFVQRALDVCCYECEGIGVRGIHDVTCITNYPQPT